MYFFKRKARSKDYVDGEVKTFSREEIENWEKSPGAAECYAKLAAQQGLSSNDLRYLDTIGWIQAEETFEDIMEGYTDGIT